MPESQKPLFTVEVQGRKFEVFTLPSYTTAYYYCNELGGREHFQTVRRLTNAIKRGLASGKIKPLPEPKEASETEKIGFLG